MQVQSASLTLGCYIISIDKLPTNTYWAKKLIRPVAMKLKKFHTCPNHCILYRGKYENLQSYPHCGASRYMWVTAALIHLNWVSTTWPLNLSKPTTRSPGAHVKTPLQDQFERENTSQQSIYHITSSSIKVYKSWFTHLVHHTVTHHSLHRSLAEVFQHNIVYDNGYMGVPHPCIYGTRDSSSLLIWQGFGSIKESMHRSYVTCKT